MPADSLLPGWITQPTTPGVLNRAYLLKEQLRQVLQLRGAAGIALLDRWLAWAQRCRIEAFVKLARTIRRHRGAIDQTLPTGTGNALVESTNTKLRVIPGLLVP